MKKTNKILLSLGTIGAVVAPVVSVISCGENKVADGYYKNSFKIILNADLTKDGKNFSTDAKSHNVLYLADIAKKATDKVTVILLANGGKRFAYDKTQAYAETFLKAIATAQEEIKNNPKATIDLTNDAKTFLSAAEVSKLK